MADLAPDFRAKSLDEVDGLTACRQLSVCGLGGSEVQLPLEDNMTVEGLHKSVAGRIGMRLGGMLVLATGGNTLDDSKPLLEQVQGDVITYVVQRVALAMFNIIFACFSSWVQEDPMLGVFLEGLRGQPRLVQSMQQLHFCEPATANA